MTAPVPETPLPKGLRYKGSRRAATGITLIVIGAMAACNGLTGATGQNGDSPVPGGILFIIVGIILWRWGKSLKTKRIVVGNVPTGTTQPTETASPPAAQPAQWVPPRPSGAPVEPWARGQRLEIVGEAYRPDAYRKILGQDPGFRTYSGAETTAPALLVPDPGNPYGKGEAVAVYLGGEHVGYLAQEDAHRYHTLLVEMQRDGEVLQVPARAWGSDTGGGRVNARVYVTIPEPHGLRPSNDLPAAPHALLPPGRRIQVTKEDEHMDVLARHVRRGSGADSYVAATLRSINEVRPRSAYEAVQVEIDGERVGVLTKGQSEKLLPLVRHVERRGLVPVVRAVVKGTRLKAEVVLDTVDAETVDDDWLDGLGEAVTEANVDRAPQPPRRPDFEWDDEEE